MPLPYGITDPSDFNAAMAFSVIETSITPLLKSLFPPYPFRVTSPQEIIEPSSFRATKIQTGDASITWREKIVATFDDKSETKLFGICPPQLLAPQEITDPSLFKAVNAL